MEIAKIPLTKRQAELFSYIRNFMEHHGYAPSYKEMMTVMGVTSTNSLACFMDSLVKKGWITRPTGPTGRTMHRAIVLTNEPPEGGKFDIQ